MLEVFQWQSIKQRIDYNTMIMIHTKNGLMPKYLQKKIHKKIQNGLFYKRIKMYNELENENETKMNHFKRKLSYHIKSN